jgi:hypothetical protein
MLSFAFLSMAIVFILLLAFCDKILKPDLTFHTDNKIMSIGDLIGTEVGGTLGLMIKDDPVDANNKKNDKQVRHLRVANFIARKGRRLLKGRQALI